MFVQTSAYRLLLTHPLFRCQDIKLTGIKACAAFTVLVLAQIPRQSRVLGRQFHPSISVLSTHLWYLRSAVGKWENMFYKDHRYKVRRRPRSRLSELTRENQRTFYTSPLDSIWVPMVDQSLWQSEPDSKAAFLFSLFT